MAVIVGRADDRTPQRVLTTGAPGAAAAAVAAAAAAAAAPDGGEDVAPAAKAVKKVSGANDDFMGPELGRIAFAVLPPQPAPPLSAMTPPAAVQEATPAATAHRRLVASLAPPWLAPAPTAPGGGAAAAATAGRKALERRLRRSCVAACLRKPVSLTLTLILILTLALTLTLTLTLSPGDSAGAPLLAPRATRPGARRCRRPGARSRLRRRPPPPPAWWRQPMRRGLWRRWAL